MSATNETLAAQSVKLSCPNIRLVYRPDGPGAYRYLGFRYARSLYKNGRHYCYGEGAAGHSEYALLTGETGDSTETNFALSYDGQGNCTMKIIDPFPGSEYNGEYISVRRQCDPLRYPC